MFMNKEGDEMFGSTDFHKTFGRYLHMMEGRMKLDPEERVLGFGDGASVPCCAHECGGACGCGGSGGRCCRMVGMPEAVATQGDELGNILYGDDCPAV